MECMTGPATPCGESELIVVYVDNAEDCIEPGLVRAGANVSMAYRGCLAFDRDGDGRVDLRDYALLQSGVTQGR